MIKKILLLVLAVSAFSSCSSDSSDSGTKSVKARINGEMVTFNTISVIEEVNTDEGYTYTDLRVTASVNNNPDKRISFVIEEGVTGLEASWFFAYFLNDTFYPKLPGFQVAVTTNENNRIKGTFAGEVQADVEPFDTVAIENGSFDIAY